MTTTHQRHCCDAIGIIINIYTGDIDMGDFKPKQSFRFFKERQAHNLDVEQLALQHASSWIERMRLTDDDLYNWTDNMRFVSQQFQLLLSSYLAIRNYRFYPSIEERFNLAL